MKQKTDNVQKTKQNQIFNVIKEKKFPSNEDLYKDLNKRSFKLSLDRLNAFYISADSKYLKKRL